jgi:superfamily II DNA or RNA helicase
MESGRVVRGSWPATAGPDHGLAWHVGDAVLARARSVLARGCVLTCEQTGSGELRATVSGTRPWPYEVSVAFVLVGARVGVFEGECDCPVELDCKHAVAALLQHLGPTTLRAPTGSGRMVSVVPDVPEWEVSLTHLLGASRKSPAERDRVHTALALQVSVLLHSAADRSGAAMLRIRPIQFNARNRWVSSGVSWRDLRYGYYTAHYQPQQLESLRGIADLELRRNPNQALSGWIALDGPGGSQFWDALADAQQAGIDLLLDGSHTPVELCADPAELMLDLVRGDHLRLTPVVRLGERTLDPASSQLIGQPAHGLIIGLPAGRSPTPPIALVRLRRPLTAELAAMLAAGSIPIPASDEHRFLTEFVPALRRRIPVLCSDGSVTIPAPTPPHVVLTATREPGHRTSLRWQWQDESGDRREFGDRRGASRADRSVLHRVIESVLAAGVLPPTALTSGPDGPEPLPRFLLEGPESVRFMTRAWPVLSEMPELVTELDGSDAGLRYRPAVSPPVLDIGFDDDGDGDDDDSDDDEGGLSRDWLGLAVRVSVDGEVVPFELVFRALAGDDPMIILPSGTYLDRADLDEGWDRLRELIEESRAMDELGPDELRIDGYTASRWSDLEESGLLGARAACWRDRVRELAVGPGDRFSAEPVPDGLRAELRSYQREGLDWLRERFDRGLGGILADDMGLGKTVQMLGLVAHARSMTPAGPPLLVVAPTSVIGNWMAEAARFTPGLRMVAVTQGNGRRGCTLAAAVAGADLVVTSYQLFRLGHDEYRQLPWSGLILDEAQFVKNVQSKGFRCARDFPAPVTFAVTGTPLENNLMEFWALLAIAAPGLFPDSRRFTEYYRLPIERGGLPDRLAQLRRRVAPFLLRRTKEQVAPELPLKLEQVIELDLSPRHQQVYQRHLQRERQKILGLLRDERSLDDNRFQILRSLTLLRQLSLDPSLVDEAYRDIPSSKLELVTDRIDEIVGTGHRVLVFSQFTRFLARTRDRLDSLGIAHCLLDGRTKDRAAVVDAFRSGAAPVFLISLKAGGFGLNLTEADYCILLDPWWNPAAEAQAIDRAHRIGQRKNVIVHRYVARGTIEEKVMALKAGKAKLFDDVLGGAADAGRSGGAPLTADEIRELLG